MSKEDINTPNSEKELAEYAFATMQTFFESLMKHSNESSFFMGTAMELMNCPIAFANSDFTLQQMPSIPKNTYIQIPFCVDYAGFDWISALDSFHIQSAHLHPDAIQGIGTASISGYFHTNSYLEHQHRKVLIFPIEDSSLLYGYVLCAPEVVNEEILMTPKRAITIQLLQLTLKLEISKSDEISQTVNRYYDFILDELLSSDNVVFEELIQKYGLVKKPVYDSYYIIMYGKTHTVDNNVPFREFLTSQRFNVIYAAVCSIFSCMDFFMFENKESIILFMPSKYIANENILTQKVIELRDTIIPHFQGAGISALITKDKIRQGFFQAQKALSLSRRSKDGNPCSYDSLGILRYFFDHSGALDTEFLMAAYNEYLLPVIEYDQLHNTRLIPTLEAYITFCSSTSLICKELYIHKNTLYSRLDKIERLIKHGLQDSNTILNINLSLKVRTLIETGLL